MLEKELAQSLLSNILLKQVSLDKSVVICAHKSAIVECYSDDIYWSTSLVIY